MGFLDKIFGEFVDISNGRMTAMTPWSIALNAMEMRLNMAQC